MAITHTYVKFFIDEPAEILSEMERINESPPKMAGEKVSAKSWMNLLPWLEYEDMPNTSMLVKFFSARGPDIPQATWVPASEKDPASLGISHSAGRHASRQLVDAGVEIPASWVLKQDHPRRGLIFELPQDEPASHILDFMIEASKTLSEVSIDTRWVADILEQVSRKEKRRFYS